VRIASFDLLEADGGFHSLWFLKVSSDEGITGWAEFSEGLGCTGLAAIVRQLMGPLVGRDPRRVALLTADLRAEGRLSNGGLIWQAIGAIENACLDLKARALGVPVCELLGGPVRDRLPVYWSHCGMRRLSRDTAVDLLGVPHVQSPDDLVALGREVAERGFRACKTNPIRFGEGDGRIFNPGFRSAGLEHGRVHPPDDLSAISAQLAALRAGAGPSVGIALDLNFGFTLDGIRRLSRIIEEHDLMWLEVDVPEPVGLAAVRASARTPIASLESICGIANYRPFLEARAVDVAIVDVMWNGMLEATRIAALAGSFDVNVATHGYSGALATAMAAQFAASVPNLEIVELEVDNAPWANDFLMEPLVVEDGQLVLPEGPGWGIEVNEAAIRGHPVSAVAALGSR
jgi:galactonate dehydratase